MMFFPSSAMRLRVCPGGLFGVGLMCVLGSAGAQTPMSMPMTAAAANPPITAPRSVGAVPTEGDRPPFVGSTARHLLDAQANGRAAAPGQPVYGATASLSWKRYVDTFSHPIPEFLESRVGKKSSQ